MNSPEAFLRASGLALLLSAAALAPVAAGDMADGEVRKVDKDGGKLTLKHGDIKNLDMPAMTMVFVVKDKTINDAGKFTVTEMQTAP